MIDKNNLLAELKKSVSVNCWSSELSSMFIELSKGVASHRLFAKHSHLKEDLSAEGLLHLVEIWKKYDFNNPANNPFGFYTKSLFRLYMKICRSDDKHNSNRDFYCDDQDAIDDLDFDYEQ